MVKKTIEDLDVWIEYARLVKPLGSVKPKAEILHVADTHSDFTTPIHHSKPKKITIQPNLKNVKIQARIDLHGMTLELAHLRLMQFIQNAHHAKLACVLVITGKGAPRTGQWWQEQGVLRLQVPRWLQESPFSTYVSTHCIAKPEHGGTGAFYVFIKKKTGA